jgi:hypothetical protein
VLRKKSNDVTAQGGRGDAFLAKSTSAAAYFSWVRTGAGLLIEK